MKLRHLLTAMNPGPSSNPMWLEPRALDRPFLIICEIDTQFKFFSLKRIYNK
jgi:hypothetical protein